MGRGPLIMFVEVFPLARNLILIMKEIDSSLNNGLYSQKHKEKKKFLKYKRVCHNFKCISPNIFLNSRKQPPVIQFSVII